MTNLEAALAYARQGWQVLPIDPTSKRPANHNGVRGATTSEQSIVDWWGNHPSWNVGIATGAPGPDVLDIDDLSAFDDTHDLSALDDAPYVDTARGRHYYFVGTDQRTVGLGYGELRRQGSYVIAPPSVHPSGKRYTWGKVGLPVDVAPEWITANRTTAGAGEAPTVTQVPPGEMYDHLLDFSVRLARGGVLDPGQREAALLAEFDRVRIAGAAYNGSPDDTRRLAHAATEILDREAANGHTVLREIVPMSHSVEVLLGGGLGNPNDRSPKTESLQLDLALEMQQTKYDVDWVVPGFIGRGWSVLVTGREKVAGKGTLVAYLLAKLERGDPTVFGEGTRPVTALVVSEEPVDSLSEKYRRFDLREATVIQGRNLTKLHLDWANTVTLLVKVAVDRGHGILYLDNVSRTAKADNDDESGTRFARKVEALADAATEAGLTLIVDHHNRKSGGKTEDRFRGGTALPGAMDNILNIERDGGWESRRRSLSSRGRVSATVWERTIELSEAGDDYTEVLGDHKLRVLASRDQWTAKEFGSEVNVQEKQALRVLRNELAEHVEELPGKPIVFRVRDRAGLLAKMDHYNDDLPEI